MDLRYLRFFIAVAEESNFTRAAERLNTVQPSLSNQIKRLEEIVGTPLLIRDRHRTRLTVAGKAFLQHSYKLLENFRLAIESTRAAARVEEESLTIGYVPASELIFFPKAIPALHERFPGMNFRLVTGFTPQLLDGLQNGVLDFVFGERIETPTIASKVLCRLRLVVAIPAGHPLAALSRIPPSELAKYPFIAPAAGHFPDAWRIINSIGTASRAGFRPIAEVDSALATVNAVRSGLGVAIVPEFITQIVPSEVLIRHLDLGPEPWLDYCISYCKDNNLSQDVLQLLLHCLSEEL